MNPRLVDALRFETYRANTLAQLNSCGLDLMGDHIVSDAVSAVAARSSVALEPPDLLLLAFPAWIDEALPLAVVDEYSGAFALWSDYEGLALAGLSGLVSTQSNLVRLHSQGATVLGPLEHPVVRNELVALAMAASARRALRAVRVGLVGLGCPGMIGVDFDELALASLGPQIVRLDLTDLLDRAQRAPARVARQLGREAARNGRVVEPTGRDFERSMRLYLAFRSLAEEHGLQIVGVRCWPELRLQHGFTPCLAFARLMEEGIVGVCENDPASGVTMLLGQWFSRESVFLGDISRVDPDANTLRLWHCGAASTRLACPTCTVELRHNRAVPLGVQVEFMLRPGRVTIARLSRPLSGRIQLFLATGEVVESAQVRGNAADIRLDAPVADVLQTILSHGIEHHLVLSYGDQTACFRHLARLLDLELVWPEASDRRSAASDA